MTSHRISSIVLVALISLAGAAQPNAPAKPQTSASSAAPTGKAPAPKASSGEAVKTDLAAADLRGIKKPPLPAFHPQQPKRIQFDNGMVVFLQEDHELPLIEAGIIIRGGSKNEPEAKTGLVSIYGSSWRTGGTKAHTGDQLDDLLEARAAHLETSSLTVLSTFMSLSCLKGDFDFVLELANDLLHNPEFRQEKIDLAKDSMRAQIARRNDTLGQIAGREATKIGYGAHSPYARVPEYATVAAVTRQDLLDWHARYVHPNNMIVSVAGDFDAAEMETKLRKMFADWPKGSTTPVPDVPVPAPKPGVYFVAKDDVNQTEIRMISAGIRRDDPDYYAVSVMNEVFGGGFASRLFSNLRTKAGLAYSVGGGVGSAFDHPGLANLVMGTKSGTTAQAIDGLYNEMEVMRDRGVTQEELDRGKDAILNSFVFEYDSKVKVMNGRSNLEFHGYPADFLEQFQKGVEKVTVADVNRVAKKYLDKSKFAVLVVGKAADFDKPLSSFAPVTAVDITIPQPGAAHAAVLASNPQGKALLSKVFEAAGGLDKLKSIKAVHSKGTQTVKAQGITLDVDETTVGEDKIHLKLNTPAGEVLMVATVQGGFMSMAAMGTRDMPSSQRESMLKNLRRELWSIAQHADDPQFAFAAQGTEKIGEVEASILDISGGGDQLRWFVDAKTGRVLRASYQANTPAGPATQVSDYSDWKTVSGVSLPFHVEVTNNGQPSGTVATSNIEFNPTVDAKIFDKPQQ
jgi:zinc protease